ncbi:MAG TPA: hypothetical protein VIJ85_09895, partial [Rhizomicrobium sp.]
MKLLSGEFPSADEPGLRVFVPRREYLFAMKCRAMRLGGVDENRDIEDSPAAFRRRLLFVGKDALDRPRRLAEPTFN